MNTALPVGEYLICISSVRNEPVDYSVGVVVEISDPFPVLLLKTSHVYYLKILPLRIILSVTQLPTSLEMTLMIIH